MADYTSRIRARARRLKHGEELLAIAAGDEMRRAMQSKVAAGEKPVVALSLAMVEALGLKAAQDHRLRQLAGEVTAHIVETEYGCIRTSGSHKINGDRVFASGQPFRLPAGDRHGRMACALGSVERTGDAFVISVPSAVAQAVDLTDGEPVEIEALEGALVVRRPAASATEAKRRASVAVAEIIKDRPRYPLGDLSIRALIDEGRR